MTPNSQKGKARVCRCPEVVRYSRSGGLRLEHVVCGGEILPGPAEKPTEKDGLVRVVGDGEGLYAIRLGEYEYSGLSKDYADKLAEWLNAAIQSHLEKREKEIREECVQVVKDHARRCYCPPDISCSEFLESRISASKRGMEIGRIIDAAECVATHPATLEGTKSYADLPAGLAARINDLREAIYASKK